MQTPLPSLILEGGTFRTLYTAGILDVFLEKQLMMDEITAISAGAVSACSYLSKQPERTLRVIRNYRNDPRYMGMGNFLSEQSYFGLEFAYDTIPNQLDKFDWETFKQYKGTIEFGVTEAKTGTIQYVNGLEMNPSCNYLQATCAIPLLFPAIQLPQGAFFDGGLTEPIPIERAMARGRQKHVVILTRPKGYRKTISRSSQWARNMLRFKYPAIAQNLKVRAERYNATMHRLERMEREGQVFIFRPPTALESFEKDIHQIDANYELGKQDAYQQWNALEAFIANK